MQDIPKEWKLIVNVKEVAITLASKSCKALIGIHTIIGCYSASAFAG